MVTVTNNLLWINNYNNADYCIVLSGNFGEFSIDHKFTNLMHTLPMAVRIQIAKLKVHQYIP